ncbi:MAG: hypothetical protein LBC82_02005 [Oscillospiraceae bacterium]|jgi:hypothetical protein|nr:hypothetical protein [Oscillospiraceae bacterium]
MPSNLETRVMQKTNLFDLLILKKDNEKKGIHVDGLDKLIVKTEAIMEAEDVAYVEKKIAQLD